MQIFIKSTYPNNSSLTFSLTRILTALILSVFLLSGCATHNSLAPPSSDSAEKNEKPFSNTQSGTTKSAENTQKSSIDTKISALNEETSELNLNPEVIHGTLDNGLTYYIQPNHKPENRLQLRLVVDAGSILEQEDQRGFAHFVEHMAFNGTEKYEKNSIIDYLEKTGMSFGPDINASTSFDQTIYKLDLPVGNGITLLGKGEIGDTQENSANSKETENTIEKGIDILKEWAFRIAFSPEQVKDEKGVIIEEWRGARSAAARMRDEYLPVLFRNSRYAERLPIGKMDVIRAAGPEDLAEFYTSWYRPELMAIVAVGDIDPNKMEALIKDTFEGAATTEKPTTEKQSKGLLPERKSFSVPPAQDIEFAVVTDPEAQQTQLQMLSLHSPFRLKTAQDYRTSLVLSMYGEMVRARLSEKTEQSDPPYVNGYFGVTHYLRNNDATVWGAIAREGQVERALSTLLEEERRISEFGFTGSELQRAKDNLRSRMQRIYEEREKTESGSFAGEYIRHFLSDEAAPGIEREWELTQKYLPGISLDDIRKVQKEIIRSEGAKTAIITGPEKEGLQYPSPEKLKQIYDKSKSVKIEPYQDDFSGRELIDELPEPGSIESTETVTLPASILKSETESETDVESDSDEEITYHKFTLSNGAKVVYQQTNYKNEQVLFSAFSPGGASQVEDKDYYAAVMAPSFVQAAGLGEYSPSQLQKLTSGKQAKVRPTIGDLTEGFSGEARPEDLELLFQKVYLYFTSPRRDSNLFQSYQQRLQGVLQNRRSNPEVLLNDAVTKMLFDDHPRRQPYTAERISKITEDQVYSIFNERFPSPSDFTFLFVGNLDPQEIKRLSALYLGSVGPADKEATQESHQAAAEAQNKAQIAADNNNQNSNLETWIDRGVRYTDTEDREEVYAGIAKKSRVNRFYLGSYNWSLQHNSTLTSLRKLLEIRLREKIREEAGGTYGVGVSLSTDRYPVNRYLLSIRFSCDPDRVEELSSIIDTELASLIDRPTDTEYIEKIRSIRNKSFEEALESNSFWLGKLQSIQFHQLDPENAFSVGRRIQNTTASSLNRAARSYLGGATTLEAVLFPESTQKQ